MRVSLCVENLVESKLKRTTQKAWYAAALVQGPIFYAGLIGEAFTNEYARQTQDCGIFLSIYVVALSTKLLSV